jgi:uncharacterized membrane protein
MHQEKKRAMTLWLVAIGVVMLAVAGVLLATFPWGQPGAFPFAPMGQQGAAPGSWPGPGGWHGFHHGWFMHGPRFFGGGLLITVFVVLLVLFIARRRHGGSWHDGPDRRLDAEEILRRSFAEGRITEEEYKSRLGALRK